MSVQADEEPWGDGFDCPWCPMVLDVRDGPTRRAMVDAHVAAHARVLIDEVYTYLYRRGAR